MAACLDLTGAAKHEAAGACPKELLRIMNNHAGQDSLELRQFLTLGGGMNCMVSLLLTQASGREMLVDRAEKIRAALEQNGTSSGGGSTTNLVSKGIAAQVLSVAAEYGAMIQAVRKWS
jgi:hypothetical protein